jgi:hypothetical protein
MNPLEIPWQPFRESMRQHVTPTVLCLWWVPIRGDVEVFTGRVAYWPAADSAMVSRRNGGMVRVTDGAFYAIVTEPPKPRQLDDAIDVAVSGSNASALPASPRAALPAPAAAEPSSGSSPYPPGLD